MTRLVIDEEACKACGYCIYFCPKQALSFSRRLNKQSYNCVQVDGTKCVRCGTCCEVCSDNVFALVKE